MVSLMFLSCIKLHIVASVGAFPAHALEETTPLDWRPVLDNCQDAIGRRGLHFLFPVPIAYARYQKGSESFTRA